MELLIPACYFPTQKILINHDESLNESALLNIDHNSLQVFKEPSIALTYFEKNYHPAFNSTELFEIEDHTEYYDLSTPHAIRMNTQNMRQIVQNKKYHEDISVLIVNYHMDKMGGLEWLASIHYPAVKRLLIIHREAKAIAENALREGLIHAYVNRDEPDFSQMLAQTIQKLEWQYFIDLTQPITTIKSNDYSYLTSPAIFAFFKDFIKKEAIDSFCLIYKYGNFLLVNQKGNKSDLILRSKERLKQLAEVAAKDNGDKNVIQQLNEGSALLFFGEEKEFWQFPAKEWGNYLHPANKIPGDNHYVWFYQKQAMFL